MALQTIQQTLLGTVQKELKAKLVVGQDKFELELGLALRELQGTLVDIKYSTVALSGISVRHTAVILYTAN